MNIDFFKAVLDSEPSSVVVCDLNDTIVYMNPFAVKKYGKEDFTNNILAVYNEAIEIYNTSKKNKNKK